MRTARDRLRDIVNGFEARWGFPQAAGAIDGTHIPILRPSGESGNDYYNRKSFYSIVMQALVDHKGTSRGHPGYIDRCGRRLPDGRLVRLRFVNFV